LLVAALRRREPGTWMVILGGLVAGAVVIVAFWRAGFWWFDGVQATHEQYYLGSATSRPFSYFVVANLAAAFIAVGVVTVSGLGLLRDKRIWLLVGGSVLAVLISHMSRYTKAEVERIWLLFYPWIAIAGGALIVRSRRWFGAIAVSVQASSAIVLQAALLSKW
jgi:methylthioxylose transferase